MLDSDRARECKSVTLLDPHQRSILGISNMLDSSRWWESLENAITVTRPVFRKGDIADPRTQTLFFTIWLQLICNGELKRRATY